MGDVADPHDPTPENASRDVSLPDGSPRFSSRRWTKIREAWENNLDPGERSAVWAWTAFTVTFGSVRVLTHWIRAGHGPSGGGMSIGGKHFHHYNIGIGMLTGLGAVALRGTERHRRHPAAAIAYGAGSALIVDELALLLDLQDVYWANEGRISVDAAIGVIGVGGLATAGFEFWPAVHHAIWDRPTKD